MEDEDRGAFTGATVEEAIRIGLAEMSLDRDQVEVEIVDEGSRGILGIGARPAHVRLTPKAPLTAQLVSPVSEEAAPAPEEPELVGVARTVLSELLERMHLAADIRVRLAEPAADEEEAPVVLDVLGPEADVLVGRRGETLAALQRIVRLIVSQRTGTRANLVVDAQGYKARRERNLRHLAQRMADEAIKRGQTVVLEPMPAYERRIVHLALQGHTGVYTESIGTGHQRRVTVIPQPANRR
jgi:spoIIIJ-associated protein